MSRIGRQPVEIPSGVQVALEDRIFRAQGPKGELGLRVHPEMKVTVDDGWILVERPSDAKRHKALHGLTRTLVANAVAGVLDGFAKTLEIVGVGYKAEKAGERLTLSLGFSHPIHYDPPEGITLEVPNQTTVSVHGIDKQMVGQVAAEIRGFRPPEPYKGKGVRYQGEHVRRKAGKTAGA